jgi:hypothetical protein
MATYIDDVEGLFDRSLGVKGEGGVDLGRDLAGDDLEDLLAELDEEVIERGLDLLVKRASLLALDVGNGGIQHSGVLGLLGGRENEGGVGGGILGLVLANGCSVVSIGSGRGVRDAGKLGCRGTRGED